MPQPNVLSDVATPNRLSAESAGNSGGLPGTQASNARATSTQANVTPVGGRGIVVPPGTAGRAGMRLPGLSTLIFLGFLALTAFRIVGEFVEGNATPTPDATSAASASGPVTFGTGTTEDCDVIGAGVEFDEGTDVWWSAKMSTVQPPAAAAVVIILRNGVQISREDVPADDSVGSWDVLCSSGPVVQHTKGRYRVEVWNGFRTRVLAAGDYVLS